MEYIKTFEEFINESQLNEAKTIIYKRQYTEKHPAQSAGQYGKVRDRILETLKDGKMTKAEFDGIVKEFNLSSRWLRNNSSLFKTKGDVVSLSETGQRIYRAKLKINEKDKEILKKKITESFFNDSNDSVNEAEILVYHVDDNAVNNFLQKYQEVEPTMLPFLGGKLKNGYTKWLKWKEKNEDKLGGRAETLSSDIFGTKTFYKFDWNKVQGWAEVFQYLYNEENDNLDEASSYKIDDVIKFKDGEEWIVCKPGMRGSGERLKSDELHIKPYNKLAKERNVSLGIDVSLDYINKNKA